MASCKNVVKIIEMTRVKPSPDSLNSAINADEISSLQLQLTFFDAFWFKILPVKRVFFYQLNDSLTPSYFNSVILPKLKQSLSLTLFHYLPLAGNLKWPSDSSKPIISYTPNDGVPVSVAESNAEFDRLSSYGIYEAVELHPLIPELITSDDSASIIALQITLFPLKGFSIGITAHHTILDGKSTTMFMNSWALSCKKMNNIENSDPFPDELIPFLDRTIIKDPTGLDLDILYLNQWVSASNKSLKISSYEGSASNLFRATFTITADDIKKMRERVLSKSLPDKDSSNRLQLSTFVLTLAYVSVCMVKARGGDGDRTVYIGFPADCRTRLNPPIPESYFGNCVSVLYSSSKAKKFMNVENGFVFGAKMVSNMVEGLTEKKLFEGAKDKLISRLALRKEPEGSLQIITVAGSPRLDVYGLDFGWGRPCKVDVVSIDRNEAISMAPSRDGNKGVEVGLALKKDEMDRFSSLFLEDIF